MKKMLNHARTLIRVICRDYYQEASILLMFLTLLATILF
jgi:hypothetical protein